MKPLWVILFYSILFYSILNKDAFDNFVGIGNLTYLAFNLTVEVMKLDLYIIIESQ